MTGRLRQASQPSSPCKTDAIVAHTDAVVFALRIQPFEIWNLLESQGGFDLFNHFLDPAQDSGVGDGGEIGVEGLAEKRVHAARSSCRKILLRLVSGDFSPSRMARIRAISSKLSLVTDTCSPPKLPCQSLRNSRMRPLCPAPAMPACRYPGRLLELLHEDEARCGGQD